MYIYLSIYLSIRCYEIMSSRVKNWNGLPWELNRTNSINATHSSIKRARTENAIDTTKMHIVWNTLRKSWTNPSKHANLILIGDGEKEVFRPLGG